MEKSPLVIFMFLLIFSGKCLAGNNYPFTLLDINRWQYWQNGDGLSGGITDTNLTSVFPRNTATLVYMDGLVWGGYVQDPNPDRDSLRVGGSHYRSALQPGNILEAGSAGQPLVAADPNDEKFRVYRARKNAINLHPRQFIAEAADYFGVDDKAVSDAQLDTIRQQYLRDWQEWPVALGAPWYDRNRNGQWDPDFDEPGIVGADQLLWLVLNDLDSQNSGYFNGVANPIGLEIQLTAWAYNYEALALEDVIFKRYRVINKSALDIKDMYFGIWVDPDVGDYGDDLCGCDSVLKMGFAYDGNPDGPYFSYWNIPPTAVAYVLLQGPTIARSGAQAIVDFTMIPDTENLSMTSFGYYAAGSNLGDPKPWDVRNYYNGLRGYIPTDDLDHPTQYVTGSGPKSGQGTFWPLSGNPVLDPSGGQGDVDSQGGNMPPGDRRMMLNCGPFNLASGEMQEIVFAIVGGLGTDRLASVQQLYGMAPVLHDFYSSLLDFEAPKGPLEIYGEPVMHDSLPEAHTFILGPNFPNPFNGKTTIRIQQFADMPVKIAVLNTLGQVVKTIFKGLLAKGEHRFEWLAKNQNGRALASGLYLLRMQSGAQIQWRKMIYLK